MSTSRSIVFHRVLGAMNLTFLALAVSAHCAWGVDRADFSYVSPLPGSAHVSPRNNVVLRSRVEIDPASVAPGAITVIGSISGPHPGTLELSGDRRTLVYVPARLFALGEQVRVRLEPQRLIAAGRILEPLTFHFRVAERDPRGAASPDLDAQLADAGERRPCAASSTPPPWRVNDSGPSTYPQIIVTLRDDPEPGGMFITPNPTGMPHGNLVIIDHFGEPLFYRKNPSRVVDFKKQPDGRLSYFDDQSDQFYLMDANYVVVDSFGTGNGYITDPHELQLLPNGNALMMAYDPQPVGMDTVVEGGNPNATVIGLIIQEVDRAKNVVFQWRSWDHFEITDAVECAVDLQGASVDYVHGNAIEADTDGNLMISSRHMNEITKIDRETGDIIWRMGLNAKNNQFAFMGDTRGFSHQHDIRRRPNGNITLFDNGNCLNPRYSRGLEYALDEIHKTATLVWEYRNSPDTYGPATGNVQRRNSGGTMINWGFAAKVTDLHADGSKAFEIVFGTPNMYTYRAFRTLWRTTQFAATPESLDFGDVPIGASASRTVAFRNALGRDLTLDTLRSSSAQFTFVEPGPFTLAPGQSVAVHVQFHAWQPVQVTGALYAVAGNDTELVAQSVAVTGRGTGIADVPSVAATFALRRVSPSPSAGPVRIDFSLARDAAVSLRVLDVQGRVVADLVNGKLAAGRHEVTWNGRAAGASVPAGLYFVRYEWLGNRSVRRLVVLP